MAVDDIYNALKEAKKPLTYSELAEVSGAPYSTIKDAVQRMRKRRDIIITWATKPREGGKGGIRYHLFELRR